MMPRVQILMGAPVLPVPEFRNIMSVSPGMLLKLPTPENCQFNPTVFRKAAPVMLLLLMS